MNQSSFCRTSPGLLVSVRSASEALAALAGGADVIDVKEPDRGPLGAADPSIIAEIVRVVAGRVPVTAAAGELLEYDDAAAAPIISALPAGVSLYKLGLRGCREVVNWPARWRKTVAALGGKSATQTLPVAVVYADWLKARAPKPADVLRVAAAFGCPALLIDTCHKSSGTLLEHWPANELIAFLERARAHRIAVVLAGSLSGPSIVAAAELAPDLLAVRGAACDGGRRGTVVAGRVAELKQVIARVARQKGCESPATSELPIDEPKGGERGASLQFAGSPCRRNSLNFKS